MKNILTSQTITASAPCRIDMGGTLDISTFYYPLHHLNPCTFNIALALRTRVALLPHENKTVKISSKGFESAEYPAEELPFDHPLGLMFAVAAYFRAQGVHIRIESASPPRSALGGSSVAAVALIAAFSKLISLTQTTSDIPLSAGNFRQKAATLAHALESSVAGVPCGLQDQLAAAYGGVNAWYWKTEPGAPVFEQQMVMEPENFQELSRHILAAYCGIPHESKDINGRWVRQFLSGQHRPLWQEIIRCTRKFAEALKQGNYKEAADVMNTETAIRRKMTPDVLDEMGEKLVSSAIGKNCGARFTGAGGGGCIWAIGETGDIDKLRHIWAETLSRRQGACLFDTTIDSDGLIY